MEINIGLVEDEKNLNDIAKSYLEKANYKVTSFESAETAECALDQKFHLWVLDIMLPGKSGFQLMEEIRRISPKIPIILISARDQDFDKILGLEKGADDYIAKPFSPKELVLRVKRLIERCYKPEDTATIAGYQIDFLTHKVYDNGELIELSNREFMLLVLMYHHLDRPFTRDEILNNIWNRDYFGSDRVVDDLMRRLRRKMPRLKVETIYGYGYRMEL